jgi:hypothetical protein
MPLERIEDDTPESGPLEPDEYLQCPHCNTVYKDVQEYGAGAIQCECGEFTALIRRRAGRPPRALAARWGEMTLRDGWVAVPLLLRRHRALLGLDSFDLDLIAELEAHDRGRGIFPQHSTLAAACGISPRAVRAHLNRMEASGLITWSPRLDRRGAPTSNSYSLDNLKAALRLIAQNQEDGHAPSDGLDVLLAGPRQQARVRAGGRREIAAGRMRTAAARRAGGDSQEARVISLAARQTA